MSNYGKFLWCCLGFAVFLVFNCGQIIQAQDDSKIGWATPASTCSNQDDCIIHERIASDLNRYIFDASTYQLFVYPPDGSQGVQYDLSPFESLIGASVDFVPVDSGQLIFEGLVADSGQWALSTFDAGNQRATRLDVSLPDSLASCDATVTGSEHKLHYLTPHKLVVCTVAADGDYSLRIVNLDDRRVEATPFTRSGQAGDRLRPPWYQMATGANGSIYLQFSSPPMSAPPSSFFYNFVPGNYSISSTATPILEYIPGQQTWNVIQISNDDIGTVPEAFGAFSEIAGADENSNIYFQVIAFWNDTNHIDLVKFSPSGSQQWRLQDAFARFIGNVIVTSGEAGTSVIDIQ